MSATIFIKDWLRGPYTLVMPDGAVETRKERVPYTCFTRDTVNVDSGTVVHTAPKQQIVGIIDFLNPTGFGFTSRGVPLYMFHPLDRAHPPMIVSSKTKPSHNVIAIATVEHWEDKWPRAGITKLLGPVGDKHVERAALFLRAGAAAPPPPPEVYTSTMETHDAADDWDIVCNIDPEGCVDVDDVLFWKRDGDTIVFGIGIADVAAWVPEDSATDAYAKQLGQTLYLEGVVHTPMLPTCLSADLASLRSDGRARPVLALVYTVRVAEGSVTKRWARMMLRNRETFTYDSPALSSLAPTIMTCLRAITGAPVSTDPHEWIERAMVTYNCEAARVLWSAGVGVLRAHAGTSDSVYTSIAESAHVPEIAWLGSAAGHYVLADTTVVPQHAGLGVSQYCHCSSPLRRYADLLNQRWLHHLLFDAARPTATTGAADVAHLNGRATAAKELDRDVWFLEHSHTHTLTESDGIVLRVRPVDQTLSVYVPAWKRTVRAKCDDATVAPGARVCIRMFCDLRKTSWRDRNICSAAVIN